MFGANCGQTEEYSRLGCSKTDATISSSKDRILGVTNIRRAYIGIANSRRAYLSAIDL